MNKDKVAVLTDSGGDIPKALLERYGIYQIPLRILYRDREYLDGVSSRRIEAVIGEFGRNTDSLHAEAYICEHCSCVCETSAVRILSDML